MHLSTGYTAKAVILVIMLLSLTSLSASGNTGVFSMNLNGWGRDSVHSPKKAALLSALLPGTGQAYNRKYWKMPIVYVAGAAGAYFIIDNARSYKSFRQAYIYRMDEDPATIDDYPQLSAQQLQVYRESYRRNMELSVIVSAAVYLLQILDATVDAHLFDFDVTNDLALKWRPAMFLDKGYTYGFSGGISLTLSFTTKTNYISRFGNSYGYLGFGN